MRSFLAAAVLFLTCVVCRADSFGIGSESNVNIRYSTSDVSTPCFTGFTATSGATCSGSATITGSTSQVTYDAYGLASYGSLGAYAQGSTQPVAGGSLPQQLNVNAESYFIDSFTFTGTTMCGGVPCPATGSGTVYLDFLISGTSIFSTGASGSYCMDILSGSNPSGINCTVAANASFPRAGSPYIISQALPIVFGQASTFTIGFDVYGHITDFTDPSVGFTANYADTSSLTGFSVLDSNGNPLTSFDVTSASGTSYPTPEPSSLMLLGTGLVALVGAAKRKLLVS